MNIIYVNGRMETVNDYYDGIDVARDDMGEDWYKFMKQELDDAESEFDLKDEEIQAYKRSEETLIEEYQRYLIDVEDLIETAIAKIGEMRSTKNLREVEKILTEARKICFENT